MITLTLDLDRMAQGLQEVAGTLDATVKLSLDRTADEIRYRFRLWRRPCRHHFTDLQPAADRHRHDPGRRGT